MSLHADLNHIYMLGKLKLSESDLLEQEHLGDVHPVSRTDSLWKPFVLVRKSSMVVIVIIMWILCFPFPICPMSTLNVV